MKKYEYVPLASRVLVVAVKGESIIIDGEEIYDWTAYIDSVPGIDHDKEYLLVAQHGSKVPEKIAAILFPHLDMTKWRK